MIDETGKINFKLINQGPMVRRHSNNVEYGSQPMGFQIDVDDNVGSQTRDGATPDTDSIERRSYRH